MWVDPEDIEAYKLFLLILHLVLQPVPQGLKKGVAQVIRDRCCKFMQGECVSLFAEAPEGRRVAVDAGEERVLRDAVRLVKAGQLGKAAKRLESTKLAPATRETLKRLERLHPAGTSKRQEVARDGRWELQGRALELDGKVFDDVMPNVPRASGPGSSQWRWEHLWAVHVSGGGDALLEVCNHLAAGRVLGGVREWLAGARLVALLKDNLGVNIRPIACGEGLRAAQVGVAVKGGANLGVHLVQAALDQWVCVKADAKNVFNALHREAVFEAIDRDFPELWAWTDLCYGVEANLGFRLGSADGSVMRFIKSREGAQQGDPLGPLYLAAPLQAALERVQERHPAVVVMAYLDDVLLMGPPVLATAAYTTYLEEGVAVGLEIQPTKSVAYSPEGDVGNFVKEMPGVRGELDFINVLGVPVGKAEAVVAEMLKKDLLPGGGLASHSLEFATLPHRMWLTKATRVSSAAWLGGFAQVWGDMRGLFATVTEGCGDLGAESGLPYVQSLYRMPCGRTPPLGVEVYGGFGPAAAFLKRTPRRFSGRRYLAEDAAEEDEVDEEGDEGGAWGG
ncbi:hypothetical protein CYMTET_39884 [Cymbomonas tetramitiformis]|uniref:Reverse transcriptase domain-containing protein n=1 Tax=Cymbomonas tetramitiformis TaxID=36881 RepID=A0AAE0CAY1_9CHLO|nr:hypothetical protein CYMTET_39884 [Cymbomonas tetramitiformis]